MILSNEYPIDLPLTERAELARSANETQTLEMVWIRRFDSYIRDMDKQIFFQLFQDGQFRKDDVDFLPLVLEHSYKSTRDGMKDAWARPVGRIRLARPPEFRIPFTFADLRAKWDLWRKRKDIPPRQKFMAERIKKSYIKRCQQIWKKHSQDFRTGKEFNQSEVQQVISSQGDMARARANMIVRTETTYYYNKGRRKIYDSSDDVTHYLFIAARDQATTKWCLTRQGLVYAKSDPLLDKETPPIHWNCRSEMVPLSLLNPRHQRMIENPSLQRRNNQCAPLPKDWNRR